MCFDYVRLIERMAEEERRLELESSDDKLVQPASPDRPALRQSGRLLPPEPFQACEGSVG